MKLRLKENNKECINLDKNDNSRNAICNRMILISVNIKRNKNYKDNKGYLNDRLKKIVILVER